MTQKLLIVLDLDETLIHSSDHKLVDLQYIGLFTQYSFVYFVYKRPYVDDLLDFCFEHFDVGVWTAGSKEYANLIIPLLFGKRKPVFVFSEDRCTIKYYSSSCRNEFSKISEISIKKLKKIWQKRYYQKDFTLVVDDTPTTFVNNYGNAILVYKWMGDPKDKELLYLKNYLKQLLTFAGRWRSIEKRYWHSSNVK